MKRVFIILLFLLFPVIFSFSQGEIDNEEKIFFRNERSVGIHLNSNGYGVNFRFGRRVNAFKKRLIGLDFVGVKHPKETKEQNQYFNNSKRFVYGKDNAFFVLRGGLGYQKEIFSKSDKGGIAIRYFYLVGPSAGILKHMYYEILEPTGNPYEYYIKIEEFDKDKHSINDIFGKASFLEGLDEISLVPGGFFKCGFNFEYSQQDDLIRALEVGAMFEAYPKKIPIMATKSNNQFFITLFLTLRFGKVISGRYKADSILNPDD